MAIVRENSASTEHNTTHTTVDDTYTIPSGTTLSVLVVMCRANIDLTETPTWDAAGANEDYTLINDTGTDQGDDMRVYIYGLVSPTSGTSKIIDYTLDSQNSSMNALINYSGTIDTSVAAATNFLSEANARWASSGSTQVHSSAGTSGATMFLAGALSANAGDPISNDAGFAELAEGDTTNFAYYVADDIGGAPSAITVTYSATDQHASALIEILPAATGGNRLLLIEPQRMGGEL